MNAATAMSSSTPLKEDPNVKVMANLACAAAAINELSNKNIKVLSIQYSAAFQRPEIQVDYAPEVLGLESVLYRCSGGEIRHNIFQANLHGCRVIWMVRQPMIKAPSQPSHGVPGGVH